LKQQQFYPEGDADQSDLLIVVHYGLTGARPDSLVEAMGYNSIEEMGDAFANTGFIWEYTTDSDPLNGDDSDETSD
jgi:predicted secreted Zn-dependent protease